MSGVGQIGGRDIRLEAVAKSWGATRALSDVSIDSPAGSFTALLGPSGCGKSTFLRIVAGLETANAGRVTIGGRDVTDAPADKRDLAMVFQSHALFPHLDVAENITFGLRTRGVARSALRIAWRSLASRFESGSSIRQTECSAITARPNATLCC